MFTSKPSYFFLQQWLKWRKPTTVDIQPTALRCDADQKPAHFFLRFIANETNERKKNKWFALDYTTEMKNVMSTRCNHFLFHHFHRQLRFMVGHCLKKTKTNYFFRHHFRVRRASQKQFGLFCLSKQWSYKGFFFFLFTLNWNRIWTKKPHTQVNFFGKPKWFTLIWDRKGCLNKRTDNIVCIVFRCLAHKSSARQRMRRKIILKMERTHRHGWCRQFYFGIECRKRIIMRIAQLMHNKLFYHTIRNAKQFITDFFPVLQWSSLIPYDRQIFVFVEQ